MTASLDRSVRVAKDVVFRELDGEAVILNLESGRYFGLDPVGTRIWQICEGSGSLRSVWQAMQDEFDAPAEQLQADLLAFVDQLSSEGLVTLQ
jgi:hypothetical protein